LTSTVCLFWITFKGDLKLYHRLEPGAVHVQQSFCHHIWTFFLDPPREGDGTNPAPAYSQLGSPRVGSPPVDPYDVVVDGSRLVLPMRLGTRVCHLRYASRVPWTESTHRRFPDALVGAPARELLRAHRALRLRTPAATGVPAVGTQTEDTAVLYGEGPLTALDDSVAAQASGTPLTHGRGVPGPVPSLPTRRSARRARSDRGAQSSQPVALLAPRADGSVASPPAAEPGAVAPSHSTTGPAAAGHATDRTDDPDSSMTARANCPSDRKRVRLSPQGHSDVAVVAGSGVGSSVVGCLHRTPRHLGGGRDIGVQAQHSTEDEHAATACPSRTFSTVASAAIARSVATAPSGEETASSPTRLGAVGQPTAPAAGDPDSTLLRWPQLKADLGDLPPELLPIIVGQLAGGLLKNISIEPPTWHFQGHPTIPIEEINVPDGNHAIGGIAFGPDGEPEVAPLPEHDGIEYISDIDLAVGVEQSRWPWTPESAPSSPEGSPVQAPATNPPPEDAAAAVSEIEMEDPGSTFLPPIRMPATLPTTAPTSPTATAALPMAGFAAGPRASPSIAADAAMPSPVRLPVAAAATSPPSDADEDAPMADDGGFYSVLEVHAPSETEGGAGAGELQSPDGSPRLAVPAFTAAGAGAGPGAGGVLPNAPRPEALEETRTAPSLGHWHAACMHALRFSLDYQTWGAPQRLATWPPVGVQPRGRSRGQPAPGLGPTIPRNASLINGGRPFELPLGGISRPFLSTIEDVE